MAGFGKQGALFVVVAVVIATVIPLVCAAAVSGQADSRLQLVSPRNGQVFAPGDTVHVRVAVQAELQAVDISVSVAGIGSFEGSNYNGSSYEATFQIPLEFAGALTITPIVTNSRNAVIEGAQVTIAVRPATAPLRISLVEATFFENGPGRTDNIYVRGEYASGIERDLTSALTGTKYQSSDQNVVRVDANGQVRATGFGVAVITAKNGGRSAFASVWVEDPARPLPPVDVSAQVEVERLPPTITPFDAYTSSYVQTFRIVNTAPLPLPGRLYLIVSDLPPKVVITEAGRTKRVEPLGSPYFWASLPDGLTLQPGQSTSVKLSMWIASSEPVNFTVRVFRSAEEP